jgi:hypothetical protein
MSDPAFRMRLLADPAGTLRGVGVAVPEGVTIEVVEDTATRVHLVLPNPIGGSVTEAELERVVGGGRKILVFLAHWLGAGASQ